VRFPLATAVTHLQSLAEGIEIEWVGTIDEAAACNGHAPMVWIPRPGTATKYVVGLHEFGHILHEYDVEAGSLADEALAWEWAFAHLDPGLGDWLDHQVWLNISKCLLSHLAWPSRVTEGS